MGAAAEIRRSDSTLITFGFGWPRPPHGWSIGRPHCQIGKRRSHRAGMRSGSAVQCNAQKQLPSKDSINESFRTFHHSNRLTCLFFNLRRDFRQAQGHYRTTPSAAHTGTRHNT
jgi:hypothetical protein